MKRFILIGFLLLLSFDTAAQIGMKVAGDRIAASSADLIWIRRVVREPMVYLVVFFYVGAFIIYTTLLRYAPVGPSYAAAHGHIVVVMAISLLFLGEAFSVMQALGACCIIAGIALLAITEKPELPSSD